MIQMKRFKGDRHCSGHSHETTSALDFWIKSFDTKSAFKVAL